MGWKQEIWPEWQIEHDIGAGAYGTVYKIRRQDIGGTYFAALKVISFPQSKNEIECLRNANMSDKQISEYFNGIASEMSREFAVMEKLKGNTNIVSYEDHKIVPSNDGMHWDVLIRMELLTPLTEYLEKHSMNEYEVCRLGIDICNALSLCEKENIIHRDIKPGNIFVSDFGDFKLGDFSLAKYAEIYTKGSAPQGTYTYMAPEVYKGIGYNFTIDIYSLGLILFRLLNRGRGPFQPLPPTPLNPEILEKANQMRLHAETVPKPAEASSMMTGIIQKTCAHDPNKRYKNAAELQKALEKCKASQPAINTTRQMSHLVKKAVNAIAGYEETVKNRPKIVVKSDEKIKLSKKNNHGNVMEPIDNAPKKKTMNDFFTTAGDL